MKNKVYFGIADGVHSGMVITTSYKKLAALIGASVHYVSEHWSCVDDHPDAKGKEPDTLYLSDSGYPRTWRKVQS